MESTVLALAFLSASHAYGLPDGLLNSLCLVESGHKINAVHQDDGYGNSLGVCQLKLSTAKLLGFRGTEKQLMSPSLNVKYAAKFLAKQIHRYHGNLYRAVAAYNRGKSTGDGHNAYSRKVFKAWRAQK
jgi:soluble lytic murein transglycosylase-like protein